MNPHRSVGIAQVVFYIPITLYAQYIGIRCWKYGSRMACYMIMIFTIIRLASGALIIAIERDLSQANVTLIKVTYILLNLGIVPLLASFDGFMSLIDRENFPHNKLLRLIHLFCVAALSLATALLIYAGTLTGRTDKASLQGVLYKVGYFDFLGVFVITILLSKRAWLVEYNRLKYSHLTIVKWLLLASPFLVVRIAYGFLGIFEATGSKMFISKWSSLFGSATALALMGLLPEYIVICVYLYILHYRVRTCQHANQLLNGSDDGLIEGGHRRSHSSRHQGHELDAYGSGRKHGRPHSGRYDGRR